MCLGETHHGGSPNERADGMLRLKPERNRDLHGRTAELGKAKEILNLFGDATTHVGSFKLLTLNVCAGNTSRRTRN